MYRRNYQQQHRRIDCYWHPLLKGISFKRTKYAYYILVYRLTINIRRRK